MKIYNLIPGYAIMNKKELRVLIQSLRTHRDNARRYLTLATDKNMEAGYLDVKLKYWKDIAEGWECLFDIVFDCIESASKNQSIKSTKKYLMEAILNLRASHEFEERHGR